MYTLLTKHFSLYILQVPLVSGGAVNGKINTIKNSLFPRKTKIEKIIFNQTLNEFRTFNLNAIHVDVINKEKNITNSIHK